MDRWVFEKDYSELYYGLKQNRYMLINIANVSSFMSLEDVTIKTAEQEGFVHEDTYRLLYRKLGQWI